MESMSGDPQGFQPPASGGAFLKPKRRKIGGRGGHLVFFVIAYFNC